MPIAAMLCALATAVAAAPREAGADEIQTISGNWVLDESLSDEPGKAILESESKSGHKPDGALRRLSRSVVIFGVPVGGLPLPSGQSKRGSDVAEGLTHASYVLEKVDSIRILQEEDATQFEYGTGDLVIYRHGERVDTEDASVEAGWKPAGFVIEHELTDGTHITETYNIDSAYDELNWTVRIDAKKAKPIEIKRVYERARSAGLKFGA